MNNAGLAQKNFLLARVLLGNDSLAKNIEVRISDKKGKQITILYTDNKGSFQFRTDEPILNLDIRSNDLNFKSTIAQCYFIPKDTTYEFFALPRRNKEEVQQIEEGLKKIPKNTKEDLLGRFCPDLIPGTQDTATFKEVYACLVNNLNYPDEAQELGIEGKVRIQFVVDENGKICDLEIKAGTYAILEEESLRAAACLSGMSPGTCNGKRVPTYYMLPVTFRLN